MGSAHDTGRWDALTVRLDGHDDRLDGHDAEFRRMTSAVHDAQKSATELRTRLVAVEKVATDSQTTHDGFIDLRATVRTWGIAIGSGVGLSLLLEVVRIVLAATEAQPPH